MRCTKYNLHVWDDFKCKEYKLKTNAPTDKPNGRWNCEHGLKD